MKQKKQFVAPAVTIMNMQVETSILAASGAGVQEAYAKGNTVSLLGLGSSWE